MKSNIPFVVFSIILVAVLIYIFYIVPNTPPEINQTIPNITISKISTFIEILTPNQVYLLGDGVQLKVKLHDSNNNSVPNAFLHYDSYQALTDQDGVAVFNLEISDPGVYTSQVNFLGDDVHQPSNASLSFEVIAEDVPIDYLSSSKLERAMVIVKSPYAIGSGIIIGYENGKTKILTSKHIVDKVTNASQVTVSTNDGELPAVDILFAPNDLNIAFVYILGYYGTAASVDLTPFPIVGDAIISVSMSGIVNGEITGTGTNITSTGFEYDTFSTDADTGEGGGIFSNDTLIGIVVSDDNDSIIDTSVLDNLTVLIDLNETDPGEDDPIAFPCNLADPECYSCSLGEVEYIILNDVVFCCRPGVYQFINGTWTCQ